MFMFRCVKFFLEKNINIMVWGVNINNGNIEGDLG